MNKSKIPLVYTPDNEPYLGRELLMKFDLLISHCLEQNTTFALRTYKTGLSDLQKMACIVIPQSISIALSIRELIRQGYLFGANVLIRPLLERAMILLYLEERPEEIEKWNRGWKQGDAPGLAKMLDVVQSKANPTSPVKGYEFTKEMNDMVHGKPDSAFSNLVSLDINQTGYTVSKSLVRPDLCDKICADVLIWLTAIMGMMAFYFPNE